MSRKLVAVTLFLASLCNSPGAQAIAVPRGATILDPDIVWDIANPHSFGISPDGKLIAYISKGSLWSCHVDTGPPSKLADLPNTITAILAEPENEEQRKQSATSSHNPGYRPFYGPVHLDKHYVFSVAWTPGQDGVVYAVRKRVRDNSMVAAYHVMYASLTGAVQEIAVIEGEFGVPDEYQISFHVTPDRKYVVADAYVPLIWDVLADRPRVTPYDCLVPSPTSGRFLGVEIDTRQLVIADKDFRIVRRFEMYFDQRRRCELVWSPDERYTVCLSHLEHPSDKTEGFRIDLETGKKSQLSTGVIRDRFYFTGNGGELVRFGITGIPPNGFGDGSYGAYISILANDADREREVIRFGGPPRRPQNFRDGRAYPPILGTADGSRFAIALPRPDELAAGFHYHFVDRDGKASPFVPASDTSYITPYYPIAFADGGRRLIARWGSTLFSLPVSSVIANDEARDND
ncbi:MAG TPA: hypothetical protein VJ828_06925 [Lacipirellulaceae bacterium]|nr:hypothetical protein [Lacipirellulaceae bacterium]